MRCGLPTSSTPTPSFGMPEEEPPRWYEPLVSLAALAGRTETHQARDGRRHAPLSESGDPGQAGGNPRSLQRRSTAAGARAGRLPRRVRERPGRPASGASRTHDGRASRGPASPAERSGRALELRGRLRESEGSAHAPASPTAAAALLSARSQRCRACPHCAIRARADGAGSGRRRPPSGHASPSRGERTFPGGARRDRGRGHAPCVEPGGRGGGILRQPDGASAHQGEGTSRRPPGRGALDRHAGGSGGEAETAS